MTRLRLVPLAAAVVLAAACGDNNPVLPIDEPTADESLDIAAFVGDANAEVVSLLRTQEGAFGVPSADALFTGEWQSNCTYNAQSGRFACPIISHAGRTVVRGYQLLDASNRPQSAYDASTTASAIFVTTIIGSISRDGFSVTFSRERMLTVSGLAGNETQHTVNGTGTGTTARTTHTVGGTTRTYSMAGTETITNVVIPFPRAQGAWPLSGTITRQVTFSRDVATGRTHSGTLAATVTFNGTQNVPLVVGNRTFTLDLATGKVTRV